MATSLAVMDTDAHHCSLACAFVTLGECESVDVNEWVFFSFPHTRNSDILLNSIKVFGAGQLDVAAKAVSARFDTL